MKLGQTLATSTIALIAIALGGCSGGEPSSSDIEKIIKATVDQQNQKIQDMGGADMAGQVLHEVKKISCAEAQGASGYNCDVEIDLETSMMGLGKNREKKVVQMRFVKGDEGWKIIQ